MTAFDGCMMFGVTTLCTSSSKYFETRNYDVLINHAVGGVGGPGELIRDGYIVGVWISQPMDRDYLLGELPAGRGLTAAGEMGIPSDSRRP